MLGLGDSYCDRSYQRARHDFIYPIKARRFFDKGSPGLMLPRSLNAVALLGRLNYHKWSYYDLLPLDHFLIFYLLGIHT